MVSTFSLYSRSTTDESGGRPSYKAVQPKGPEEQGAVRGKGIWPALAEGGGRVSSVMAGGMSRRGARLGWPGADGEQHVETWSARWVGGGGVGEGLSGC